VITAVPNLVQLAPPWAICQLTLPTEARVVASVVRAGGVMSREYHLHVAEKASRIVVREAEGWQLLPKACPDRHINADGSFCIGLRAGQSVRDDIAAREWWTKLQVFLLGQETAHDSRFWPEYAQLSHGEEAAQLQLAAEYAADELGTRDAYNEAVRADSGPIAKYLGLINPTTERLRNCRAACVCGRVDRQGRPIRRRDCLKAGLPCLAVLEFKRRQAVLHFWKVMRDSGLQCCKTMNACPLCS
jgi:hypothetical protein